MYIKKTAKLIFIFLLAVFGILFAPFVTAIIFAFLSKLGVFGNLIILLYFTSPFILLLSLSVFVVKRFIKRKRSNYSKIFLE